MRYCYIPVILAAINLFFCSCEGFLEEKPYNTLAQPSQLKDLRALLDYEPTVLSSYPGHGELASDDFRTAEDGYAYMLPYMQDLYVWEDKGLNGDAWRGAYNKISIANVVLEGLERIREGTDKQRNEIEGEALFMRGWMFFHLAQVYCAPYTVLEPKDGPGLVLRLDSDSEIRLSRSTLRDSYRQIFADLERAVELLSERSEYLTRPSKLVALAALARAYLTIEDYPKAEGMVDRVMAAEDRLLDFNMLTASANVPLTINNNTELLSYATSGTASYLIAHASTVIDPELYGMYEEDDLRRQVFFEQAPAGIKFKGFYHGARSIFVGLAQDEMYLIKAECAARKRAVEEGAYYLNRLLEHRYVKDSFEPLLFADEELLLQRVLEERRKELVFRGLRWLDLRRLNRYPTLAKTLHRTIGADKAYRLEPGDLRYTFLIPQDAVDIGRYEQNPR